MMRALILLHRWLSVAFCLLFAMWFATGIVMHFVPFPALTETARFSGLAPIDLAPVAHGPAEAVGASTMSDATRVRLMQRSDGPVYLVAGPSALKALRAGDLADGAVRSGRLALAIAVDYAQRRQLDNSNASVDGMVSDDQWTVSGGFDPYRPLYRVALNDSRGTEIYVASTTGEVVLDTTRRQRAWNYVGSVAHWIYPAALRSHPAVWRLLLWWLSLLALIGAVAGAVVGTLRVGAAESRLLSPYRGWQAWHHRLGLICMLFVLTWIFSGWLSMDNGRLFSTGEPTDAERAAFNGAPVWSSLSHDEIQRASAPVKEIEWFAFGGRLYRRGRVTADQQRLFLAGALPEAETENRAYLRANEIDAAAGRLAPGCNRSFVVDRNDRYAAGSIMPNAPLFRVVCGENWFEVDGASGLLLDKLDASRRAYRWLYRALHTLDFPVFANHQALRSAVIVILCACGMAFSLTGVVIAWRRVRLWCRLPEKR